jgi:dephospho-CoA kinase
LTATPFIGLTGAIAAGKSEGLAALGRLGAATLSSDAIVHELLESERVRDLLIERWGREIAPHGAVDRGQVAAIVFEHPGELVWLEAALHPLVGERIAAWRDGLPAATPAAVVEVPLLFETDLDSRFDATIAIVAPEALRAQRAAARGTADLEGRSKRQLGQEEEAARATYAVVNDGTLADLEAALAELMAQITAQREEGR